MSNGSQQSVWGFSVEFENEKIIFTEDLTAAFTFLGAGMGEVEVVIVEPSGKKDTIECHIEDKGNSSYRCTYKPTLEGQHTIYITFAGGQISKSPYMVNVGEGEEMTRKR